MTLHLGEFVCARHRLMRTKQKSDRWGLTPLPGALWHPWGIVLGSSKVDSRNHRLWDMDRPFLFPGITWSGSRIHPLRSQHSTAMIPGFNGYDSRIQLL